MKRSELHTALMEKYAKPMADLGFPRGSRATAEFSSPRDHDPVRSIAFDAVKWPKALKWDVRLRVSVRYDAVEEVLNAIDPERRSASTAIQRAYKTASTLTLNLTPPDLTFAVGTRSDIERSVGPVMDHLRKVTPAFFDHFGTMAALIEHLKSDRAHLYVASGASLLPVCLAVIGAPADEVKESIRRITSQSPGHPPRMVLARLGEKFPHLGIDESFLDSLPKPTG
ncbi:MAG: hypothetical protein M9894_12765 [Planctomycetes bacterium]|nr:hypothetical protein [Planctomycetota bacterium]